MDPLSITASVIAILQLTTALTSYLNEVRHATAEQRKVAVEAGNLYGLLTTLRFRIEDARSDDPWFDQVKLLGVKEGPLDQFKAILEKMVGHVTVSGKREQVKSVITWRWTKVDVEEALQKMERLKSLVTIALANDTFKLAQAIHGEVTQLVSQTATLQLGVDQMTTHINRDSQDRLSRWLQIPDPSLNYQAALSKRHPGTGTWLLKSSQLQDWKRSKSSFLWLHGNAGCGKTVLSATALQNILNEASGQAKIAVAYFYFDFNDVEKQNTNRALCSLLFQLGLQIPECHHALEQAYQRCNNGHSQPSDDAIRSLLIDVLTQPQSSQIYVVLDALDECTDRTTLLPFICKITNPPLYNLHLLATSRRESDIEDELGEVANHVIDIQSAKVDVDISAYVHGRLATDTKLKKWSPAVKEEIARDLMSKANGMFRWAYCQLESLRTCLKLSALRKMLAALPKTLDETYARIIRQLESEETLSEAITVLQWLCFVDRPLLLSEVMEILQIQTGEDGGFRPEELLPGAVKTVCSSLITYHQSGSSYSNYEDDRDEEDNSSEGDGDNEEKERATVWVRLAHFSVKEYLLSERSCLKSDFAPPTCHDLIAESCLHYLLYANHTVWEPPLMSYVACSWWQHAQRAGITRGPTTTALTQELFMSEVHLLTWMRHYDPDRPYISPDFSLTASQIATPIYYASLIGLPETVSFLLGNGAEVNAQGGGFPAPLQTASFKGHLEVVQLLLNNGANVNATGGHHGNSLQAASEGGHLEVVQLLLNKGANVNAIEGYYGNSLQAASHGGHLEVVQILLDNGADVNEIGGYFDSPLHAASHGGHLEIVQLLLSEGANINATGGLWGNSLQAASLGGHLEIVQLLLNKGANVNARGGYCGNPLQAASDRGHLDIVQLLLDNGANVNARGGRDSALKAASRYGYQKVVELLLQHGAKWE